MLILSSFFSKKFKEPFIGEALFCSFSFFTLVMFLKSYVMFRLYALLILMKTSVAEVHL